MAKRKSFDFLGERDRRQDEAMKAALHKWGKKKQSFSPESLSASSSDSPSLVKSFVPPENGRGARSSSLSSPRTPQLEELIGEHRDEPEIVQKAEGGKQTKKLKGRLSKERGNVGGARSSAIYNQLWQVCVFAFLISTTWFSHSFYLDTASTRKAMQFTQLKMPSSRLHTQDHISRAHHSCQRIQVFSIHSRW